MDRNEYILDQAIRCYDNGGKTWDRYTVIYMDYPEKDKNYFTCFGMSEDPFYGFGQHGIATPGIHLGKRIKFDNLPEFCKKAIIQDLK